MASDVAADTRDGTRGPAPTRRAKAPNPQLRKWVVIGVVAVVVIAAVVIGLVLWNNHQAQQRTAAANAAAKVAVTQAAEQGITQMTHVDFADPNGTLNRWLSVTGGGLHDSLTSTGASLIKQIVGVHFTSTGQVQSVDVTSVDAAAGTASLTASVNVTLGYAGLPTSTKNDTIDAQMVDTSAGWKLSSMAGASLIGG